MVFSLCVPCETFASSALSFFISSTRDEEGAVIVLVIDAVVLEENRLDILRKGKRCRFVQFDRPERVRAYQAQKGCGIARSRFELLVEVENIDGGFFAGPVAEGQ